MLVFFNYYYIYIYTLGLE